MSDVRVKKLIKCGNQYAFAVWNNWFKEMRYYHTDETGRRCFEGPGYGQVVAYDYDFDLRNKTPKEVVRQITELLG